LFVTTIRTGDADQVAQPERGRAVSGPADSARPANGRAAWHPSVLTEGAEGTAGPREIGKHRRRASSPSGARAGRAGSRRTRSGGSGLPCALRRTGGCREGGAFFDARHRPISSASVNERLAVGV